MESFCLSKVFIIFGVATEGANTLARFLQGGTNGNDNLNGKTNVNGNGNIDGNDNLDGDGNGGLIVPA